MDSKTENERLRAKDNDDFRSLQQKYLMQCWTAQRHYDPVAVEKADGCWIYTTDGRKIFDLRSAHECINLGFRHPKILQAMRDQMERVVYVTDDFATRPTALLARTLAEITPGDPNKRVWFGQSGAGAVEAAIKGARFYKYHQMIEKGLANLSPDMQYPYPYKIISRYRSWHGSTAGAASVSGDPRRWFIEPLTIPGVKHAPDAYCYRCPFNKTYPGCDIDCVEYIDKMIELEGGSNKVAAVIVEPIVGSNGIIPPPGEYYPRLREICDKWDIVLIADETMTGLGRTGEMFAIEHYNIVPDIIVMGKALGVYCPLSATVFSSRIAGVFDDNVFGHGQSFSGHALGCAAALAGINVLNEEKILERVREMGQYLGDRLKMLEQTHKSVGEVRGIGLFWTIELVRNRETKEPFRKQMNKYARNVLTEIAEYLLREKNIYIPADKFGIWIVPPLIVKKQEIDFIVDSIDEALKIADDKVTE
ncbi:MAG: aminotransferase family protein [Planctomycetota bacterium]